MSATVLKLIISFLQGLPFWVSDRFRRFVGTVRTRLPIYTGVPIHVMQVCANEDSCKPCLGDGSDWYIPPRAVLTQAVQ